MDEVKRTRAEYGGFLPLELNSRKEYFDTYENNLSRFNSVKAAFAYIIENLSCKKIYIPYYYCPSTTQAIKTMDLDVVFYHIGGNLMPDNIIDEESSIVLLVDYFGVCSDEITYLSKSFTKAQVIIDRAHAFFAEPVMISNIHNVYSAKKFFGIPDGSYLISQSIVKEIETPIDSNEYAGYLLKTYEVGTNVSYADKKAADDIIASNYSSMSKLAIGLLRNVDYDNVKEIRRENFEFLRQTFDEVNELKLPHNVSSYQFPLLLSSKGKMIKQQLVAEKIFVSTLWKGEDLLNSGNEFELNMSENAVFLTMDQRYGIDDMKYIANETLKFINSIGH